MQMSGIGNLKGILTFLTVKLCELGAPGYSVALGTEGYNFAGWVEGG